MPALKGYKVAKLADKILIVSPPNRWLSAKSQRAPISSYLLALAVTASGGGRRQRTKVRRSMLLRRACSSCAHRTSPSAGSAARVDHVLERVEPPSSPAR